MKDYTEEMRMSNEYPEVGQSVILNLLVDHEGLKKYNGAEIKLLEYNGFAAPLFYCAKYNFKVRLNSAHFKAVPPNGVETETPEEANEFDRIEMVNRVNNEAEDWPKVGDDVYLNDLDGSHKRMAGKVCTVIGICKGKGRHKIITVEHPLLGHTSINMDDRWIKKPKTPEQILTGKVESLIADSLKESNFNGDIGLGDIASIITSNLELYFKVSDL